MLIQPWIKVTYCSLLWLALHIRVGINISYLSIPGTVADGRCYISRCCFFVCFFLNCFLCNACILQLCNNLTSFLFKSRFISLLLFIHLFLTFFFFWLNNFFHMKRLRLVDYFVCFESQIILLLLFRFELNL